MSDDQSIGDAADTDAHDAVLSEGEYCRRIEAHLCRRNDGHLIRIVGPAFERVCGWAARGIPLKVAVRGIDRCFQRYHSKGLRRWPVRVEFCENDVLDVFDEWRRAVGVTSATPARDPAETGAADADSTEQRRRGPSLVEHANRVLIRISSLLASSTLPEALRQKLDHTAREVDEVRAAARGSRGSARRALIERLSAMDRALLDAVLVSLPADTAERLRHEATVQLAPFKTRMPDAAYREALDAAMRGLARDRLGLPRVALE
jgi:hypothetical protein